VITQKHGVQVPKTFSGGSTPKDEIFCSSLLHVVSAGYLAHRQSTGDHRPIWIDISTESLLGSDMQQLPSYNARQLKCQDPRIVAKYNSILKKYLTKHGVYDRVYNLFTSYSTPLIIPQWQEYEKLDIL
jgi:hypothetical protein